MTPPDPLDLLDAYPGAGTDEEHWRRAMTTSLLGRSGAWLRIELDAGRSWVLLGWVDLTAHRLLLDRDGELVAAAAYAIALLEGSPLDRRDVIVVAMLLRRACSYQALDFAAPVGAACDNAGPLGDRCREWLPSVSGALPPPYREVVDSPTVRFVRGDGAPPSSDRPRPPSPTPVTTATAAEPDVTPWPAPVRHAVRALGAVVLAFGLIGLVTVLYDRGVIPIAGPFVALVLTALIVTYVRPLWRRRQVRRAAEALVTVRDLLAAEQARDGAERPSGADDAALARATHHADAAHQRLAWADERAAVDHLDSLEHTAGPWHDDADLTRAVVAVGRYARRIRRVLPGTL